MHKMMCRNARRRIKSRKIPDMDYRPSCSGMSRANAPFRMDRSEERRPPFQGSALSTYPVTRCISRDYSRETSAEMSRALAGSAIATLLRQDTTRIWSIRQLRDVRSAERCTTGCILSGIGERRAGPTRAWFPRGFTARQLHFSRNTSRSQLGKRYS